MKGGAVWGLHDYGWGIGMIAWMLLVWAAVLITAWIIFRDIGGPKHHYRR